MTVVRVSFAAFVLACAGCGDVSRVVGGGTTAMSGGAPPMAGAGGSGAVGASGAAGGAGAGGSSGGDAGAAGAAGATQPNISGAWAMYYFEDPVAVSLTESNGVLSGMGCCAGLRQPSIPGDCCGPITNGTLENRRARFSFTPGSSALAGDYQADVTVSESGDRMLGRFAIGDYVGEALWAWARIPEGLPWLGSGNQTLQAAVLRREGRYPVVLGDGSGGDFSPDRTYLVDVTAGPEGTAFVLGELGSFWSAEMIWNETDQTLLVGPVSATLPEVPVALVLHFAGMPLVSIDATMASGATYQFVPM